MTAQKYIYNENGKLRDEQISVYPSLSVLSESSQSLAVLATEHTGGVSFTVSCSGCGSVYRWQMPAGKHGAGIFITVSALVKTVLNTARGFFRQVVWTLKRTMLVRRPACLRL